MAHLYRAAKPSFLSAAIVAALLPAAVSAQPAPPAAPPPAAAAAAAPAAAGRKVLNVGTRPESVTRGFGGKLYITVMNEKVTGDGVVKVIDGDTVKDFATEMDEPKGICFTGKFLVTSDVHRLWKIDEKGQKSVLVDAEDFPQPVSFLNDVACEPGGKAVFVSDMGANTKMRDPQSKLWPLDSPQAKELPAIGRIYRVELSAKVSIVVDARPDMPCPNGVTVPQRGRVLIGEFFNGTIFQSRGKSWDILANGLRGADGVEEDGKGNLYVSSWEQGKVWRIARATAKKPAEPEVIAEGFQSAADFFLDRKANMLLLPDMKAGTLTFIPLK